ncbi:T9SS type B sorting domain-containing protein [Aquimarina sp. RZ0]|uniref:T9SS type B sorting domain-containing protein n=1 Tax=Aquimarina sp. RZ0 TaxID=2607730 RepID=UPI0011F1875E|nr:T9SS type B sorting domain-containing protein [Aquimarina sp. RZ0]KAA1247858.1 T9SS type B sorting domain-containing protein [Aquimarina sp. RZ0]
MRKAIRIILLLFTPFFSVYAQNEPTDCINTIIICGNTSLELNSNGVGINDFSIAGNNAPDCGFMESQSLWIRVNIVQSGTLAFTITPESVNPNEDYDFAIYGPNVSCTTLGSSIRCSSTNPPAAGVSTLTGLRDTETDESEGPGSLGNGFVRPIDAIAGEEYYILIDNFSQNGGFDLQFTGTALLPDSPINNADTNIAIDLDLTECDIIGDGNDGMTNFDLESNTAAILGTQSNTVITYHATEEDANINLNPLVSPYTSTQNNQIIYTRIENTITGCFIVDTFNLITQSGTLISAPTPFILCDTTDDGNDTNGFASFLLTEKNPEILNGLDPLANILTYHISQSDADSGVNTINTAVPYTNIANPQTIYARVQDASSSLCFSIVSLDLQVNPLPIANATSLMQCDEYMNPTDGITLFNLNQAIDQITGGIPDQTVVFFEDQATANTGVPAITNTEAYQNVAANQQLFVRVTNDLTGCFRITTLDLTVSTTSANDAILSLCDDDGTEDGFREFDLTLANPQVLMGIASPNLSVAYYETIEAALSENNPITSYINTTSGTQGQDIVYVRVENNLNQCFGINQVSLFVNPLPDIEGQTEVFLCEGESISIDAGLQSGDINDFDYLWMPSGETTQSIIVTQNTDYTVMVTNSISNCSKNRTVTVNLSSPATIQEIVINDASDNNTVTINVTGLGNYEYAITLNNSGIQNYQDSPTFTNVPPGFHRVYIRDKNGCEPEATEDIAVIGFPKYFTPNGDGFHETWNIKGIATEILGNSIIYIFDRKGKLLKQLTPNSNGWDGTYGGQIMPSGQYWFRVQLEDGRIRKGSFSLIR